ncbi:siderophore-interacting protein [Dyella sp. 333MFSha]|uniref:siderophore-interacting protein n=1 Tax=Dyella sp. 333MFSha TaxID=1798240 RepID=UPI00089103FB|nr:siderophore-interacting protein [Dyella sp. 333MFSha]SDG02243.1 NADPH-dependent ferric siderophore reductase, contains FAD-binding and SIP domains [Dyella sp. 333MFSha]
MHRFDAPGEPRFPPYAYRDLEVVSVRKHRGLIRVVLGGKALADLTVPLPAAWVKVFLPGPSGDVGRAYTVRRFDPVRQLLEIDVVRRRQGGALSNWIYERLAVGDHLHVAGPRGGVEPTAQADWHLLLGDETALPAIASMVEAGLPGRSIALVEVPFPDDAYDENPLIQFLFRGRAANDEPSYLETALDSLPTLPGRGRVWIAGEAAVVKRLKRAAVDRWGPSGVTVHAAGYWKMGQTDYKDDALVTG